MVVRYIVLVISIRREEEGYGIDTVFRVDYISGENPNHISRETS